MNPVQKILILDFVKYEDFLLYREDSPVMVSLETACAGLECSDSYNVFSDTIDESREKKEEKDL